jgi:nucleoid-associated protein YgaU
MKRHLRFGILAAALVLAGHLRAADQPAPAQNPDELASLRADNKQLSDELAAAWKESEKLKADLAASQAALSKSADQSADLQKQLDAAKASAPRPEAQAPAGSDGASQLSDTQDKLATALRSFTVVQDENTALKASIDKLTAENASLSQQLDAARSSISSLQVQAAATSQIDPLRSEVRNAQDEISRLAAENSDLRARLSLQPPSPAGKPVPMRPAEAPAVAAAPAPAAAAPAPAPAPRTYVVVEGDTLTRISRRFYGTSARWEDILNANRDILKDEKSLVVGSSLTIP